MHVRASLGMHRDAVGARVGEFLHVRVDRRDHKMHVKRSLGVRLDGANDERSDRDVRHEMPVHHIHMDQVGAGRFNCRNLGAKLREISR